MTTHELAGHPDNMIWLDMEMSGLDPLVCRPLEIATIVTDGELNILAEGPNIVIHQPREHLDTMDEWNTRQHAHSGLTRSVLDSRISCAEAEATTLSFVADWTQPRNAPLVGNSIAQDRRFIRRYMPLLNEHLHYRMIDISSIKELVRRWYGIQPPPKAESHRALDDVRESIEELVSLGFCPND